MGFCGELEIVDVDDQGELGAGVLKAFYRQGIDPRKCGFTL